MELEHYFAHLFAPKILTYSSAKDQMAQNERSLFTVMVIISRCDEN